MSLMAAECRAFIYSLVRVSKPELVAEIGTFFAGTAEVFARECPEERGKVKEESQGRGGDAVTIVKTGRTLSCFSEG